MSSDNRESLSTGLRMPVFPQANMGDPGTSKADKKKMISRYKLDTAGHTSAQSWFFENCNKALAEKIVSECPHMGNTLMRKISFLSGGCSFVITKRLESPERIVHHHVTRIPDGFELTLQNVIYTLKTLDEVMDTFVRETGPSITHPMKSNNPKELGVEFDGMKSETGELQDDDEDPLPLPERDSGGAPKRAGSGELQDDDEDPLPLPERDSGGAPKRAGSGELQDDDEDPLPLPERDSGGAPKRAGSGELQDDDEDPLPLPERDSGGAPKRAGSGELQDDDEDPLPLPERDSGGAPKRAGSAMSVTLAKWLDVSERMKETERRLQEKLAALKQAQEKLLSIEMESATLVVKGGQPRDIAELKAHQGDGRGARSEDEQVQPVVSCELTSEESDDSTSGSLEGLLTEEADGTCPVFSMRWQGSFTVPSATGGTFQLQNSDVVLSVPPNAVPIKEAHIQSAICTDIDYIHDKLHLEDEEEIVSPLVEYRMTEPFCFQKPVSIILPHKCFHEEEDSSLIYVYHVSMNEDRTLDKRRLVNVSSLNAEEESSEQDILPHFLIMSDDRIITETRSFSAYFVCKLCKKNESKPPNLYAAVGGKFTSEEMVSVKIRIWDWRLKCEDFQQVLENDQPWSEPLPLQLLEVIQDTQLLVSLRMNKRAALVLDTDGNELTSRQQVFELPHQLFCKRCLRKGRLNFLHAGWLLKATGSEVALTVDIDHRIDVGGRQQNINTSIPCVISRGLVPRESNVQTMPQRMRVGDHTQRKRPYEMSGASCSIEPVNPCDIRYQGGRTEAMGTASGSANSLGICPPRSAQLPPPVNCEEEVCYRSRQVAEPFHGHLFSELRRDEAEAGDSRYHAVANGPSHSARRDDIPLDLRLDSLK